MKTKKYRVANVGRFLNSMFIAIVALFTIIYIALCKFAPNLVTADFRNGVLVVVAVMVVVFFIAIALFAHDWEEK